MHDPLASVEFVEGLARLELRRPSRHNAVDEALKDAMSRAVDEIEALGDRLRCVVVGGAGRSFCSGADLKILDALTPAAARQFMLQAAWTFRRIARLPVPVIGAAKGFCLGGGFELLLHCDIVIASEDAVFGFPETSIGLTTTAGSVDRLLHAIGSMRARDMLLTGRRVSAAEALTFGLVSEVVAVERLDDVVLGRAKSLASSPREGLAAMKAIVQERIGSGASASWTAELDAFEALFALRRAR